VTDSKPKDASDEPSASDLGPFAAVALVFGSSASVLIVELVALRLLAPYLGLTLETNTMVIGLALAAIAVGSWWGGRAADVIPPRRALGPLLAISGVAVAVTPAIVRTAGSVADGSFVVIVAALAILVPGALLSAVTPMVTKLRLRSLSETGTVVGRLSATGTAGAIFGTVLTGFVLVSRVPVSGIMVSLGIALVLASAAVETQMRGWGLRATPAALVLLGGVGWAAVAPGGCDAETTYHCAVVEDDPARDSGRVLVLDGLRHSYVDLADATHLEFEYVRAIASVTDVAFAADESIQAYHLGGGGLTIPRYLDEVRPGTDSVVSEIDAGVVEVDTELLGLRTGDGIEVRVEDGRLGLRRLTAGSQDLVVGDAFGGVSVPWHLTTREAIEDVRRVLAPGGVYAANLIDHGSMAFARAEVTTIAHAFEHVALASAPEVLAGEDGGNLVVVASDGRLPLEALTARLSENGTDWGVLSGAALDTWVGVAEVLTDDHAPVDQLLSPYRG
jgi:spermidine synthase